MVDFRLEICETDLWWLLRRKQRKRYADERVYFFENDEGHGLRDRLLESHGAAINNGVDKVPGDYAAFYERGLDRIGELIQVNRRDGAPRML